mgnify:CR=1 FL=1
MIDISNKNGDESVGRQTFAVSFGINTTSILAFFLCLGSFVIGWYLSEPLSSVSSLSALPFFLFLIFRGTQKDILRSIAHELVHHLQNEKGELTDAGYSGKGYAQKNPHLRKMEREAYEKGNMCFRDWEDGIKNTIY